MRPSVARVLLFLGTFGPSSGKEVFDEILPATMKRLSDVGKVLMPLPKHELEEVTYHIGSYYIPIDSQTELCRNHSAILFDGFIDHEIWALRMVDASTKGSPGMMDGNIMDLGNYGQCISVEAPNNLFRGQHCVIETKGVTPPEFETFNSQKAVVPVLRLDFLFSVCVPSSCTAADVKAHVDISLRSVNGTSIIYNSSCSSAIPEPFQRKDYVAM